MFMYQSKFFDFDIFHLLGFICFTGPVKYWFAAKVYKDKTNQVIFFLKKFQRIVYEKRSSFLNRWSVLFKENQ